MPVVLERQKPASLEPRTQQRPTQIPRPIKQLVIGHNNGRISHASKPTVDPFPLATPSKTQIKSRPDAHREYTRHNAIPHDSDPELAILELVPFSHQPIVNFGQVLLGTTSVKYALLRNPLDKQQQLFVKTFPKTDKGINIDATEFLIAPHTEICVALAWTPKVIGGIRETITLQDINRMPKRIVLLGTATRPKIEPIQSRTSRNIPRLFRRSPTKVNRQLVQERNKLLFSPRVTTTKAKKVAEPLKKLQSSPQKRHQIVRKILSQNDEAKAIKIQSYCRMVLEQRRLKRMREAIVMFQSRCRAVIARREYLAKRRAAITIQRWFKTYRERRRFLQIRSTAVILQKYFRGMKARRERARLHAILRATVVLQKHFRGMKARRERARLHKLLKATIWFQSQCRLLVVRRKYLAQRRAAILIQRRFRTWRERRRFVQIRSAAIVFQRYYRGLKARRERTRLHKLLNATVWLQSRCRALIARREYLAKRGAAIIIQRWFKTCRERRRFLQIRSTAVILQKYFRGMKARRKRARLHAILKATVVLQKHFRGMKARRERARLHKLLKATIWLQSQSRGYLVRQRLRRSVEAVFKIQARYVSGQSKMILV